VVNQIFQKEKKKKKKKKKKALAVVEVRGALGILLSSIRI
jgi:hypothetical protein